MAHVFAQELWHGAARSLLHLSRIAREKSAISPRVSDEHALAPSDTPAMRPSGWSPASSDARTSSCANPRPLLPLVLVSDAAMSLMYGLSISEFQRTTAIMSMPRPLLPSSAPMAQASCRGRLWFDAYSRRASMMPSRTYAARTALESNSIQSSSG